jgi:hypothetical protein
VAAGGAFSVTLVREQWQAFVEGGVVGLGMAVVTPAQDALLATVVSPAQRPAVFAVRNATLNAGYGIGGVAAFVRLCRFRVLHRSKICAETVGAEV